MNENSSKVYNGGDPLLMQIRRVVETCKGTSRVMIIANILVILVGFLASLVFDFRSDSNRKKGGNHGK